jgi:hypothetical protein
VQTNRANGIESEPSLTRIDAAATMHHSHACIDGQRSRLTLSDASDGACENEGDRDGIRACAGAAPHPITFESCGWHTFSRREASMQVVTG